jgi:hypothetical protein
MKQPISIIPELRAHIARRYRTQKNAAIAWGVSSSFVSAVLCSKKKPTDAMLKDAGLIAVTHYVKEK